MKNKNSRNIAYNMPFIVILLFSTNYLLLTTSYADESSAVSIMRESVKKELYTPWDVQFGPKFGFFVPYNLSFRETYGGGGFSYGFSLSVFYEDYGIKFEVEHYEADRLLPLNESGKWKDTLSSIALTPFWFSFIKSFSRHYHKKNYDKWKFFVGIGIGFTSVKERFKGEYFVNNNWQYTDVSQVDTLFGIQVFVNLLRVNRLGVEVKYSYVPRRSVSGFADLGGLTSNLFFSF